MSTQVASGAARSEQAARRARPPAFTVLVSLALVLFGAAIIAITIGAAGIPFSRMLSALGLIAPVEPALLARDQLVLWSIRIPRIVLTSLIGAMLAVSGAIMQGLFRNPLADPALVGVSSGGAFAAAAAIVYTDSQYGQSIRFLQFELLPIAAFFGSLITTFILYRIASRGGRTSVAIFLLSGLAIAALANAGLGLLIFIADDRQLRDISFWLLGSLTGATWSKAAVIAPIAFVALSAVLWVSRDLDILVLGEVEAFHSGVNVQRLKTISIVAVSALTGAAVSIAGVIGFVGIVVPHVLRIAVGPGHGLLMPAAAILGAALMVVADTFARTLAAPAEVPIGILTAAIGAPFFLAIVLRQRSAIGP